MINMKYTEKIYDITTGEETIREYTKEEVANVEAEMARLKVINAEREAQEALKKSAQTKLAALGLTENEVRAIIGV